jgi:hypothetical protein
MFAELETQRRGAERVRLIETYRIALTMILPMPSIVRVHWFRHWFSFSVTFNSSFDICICSVEILLKSSRT